MLMQLISMLVLLLDMVHKGLHYLHCDAPEAIIHGDLKSSNGMYTERVTE